MWRPVALLGMLVVLAGVLPVQEAVAVTSRFAPVLMFLVAVTVLAELAAAAQVFDVAAARAARLGHGSVRRLFGWVCALATVTTVLLSLDTAAVMLTPVVVAMTLRLGVSPLPFAMAVVWLANTASLLLPVSNLTNLLAVDKLDLAASAYAVRMALPAAVAVLGTVVVLGLRYRHLLRGSYTMGPAPVPADRLLLWVASLGCFAVAPGALAGFAPWTVATPAAAAVAAAFAVRRRTVLRFGLIPWRLVLLVQGLVLVVAGAGELGLDRVLASAAGSSSSLAGLLRMAGVGAASSNAVNNLPAYLALERAVPAEDIDRLLALLVGVNVGPLVLLWGSLATLLWRDRCQALGVRIGAREFAVVGLVGVPCVLVSTAAALWVTG